MGCALIVWVCSDCVDVCPVCGTGAEGCGAGSGEGGADGEGEGTCEGEGEGICEDILPSLLVSSAMSLM